MTYIVWECDEEGVVRVAAKSRSRKAADLIADMMNKLNRKDTWYQVDVDI